VVEGRRQKDCGGGAPADTDSDRFEQSIDLLDSDALIQDGV
jgi:hypothetical protein